MIKVTVSIETASTVAVKPARKIQVFDLAMYGKMSLESGKLKFSQKGLIC